MLRWCLFWRVARSLLPLSVLSLWASLACFGLFCAEKAAHRRGALSGFRTPIRPDVVRKLLAADPASATLGDERGRTALSLLFDDYAKEVMEALKNDVTSTEARDRCMKMGGDLHECWEMLGLLLKAVYHCAE